MNTLLREPLAPEGKGSSTHLERDFGGLPGSRMSLTRTGPREKRYDGSWRADVITVVEVIRAGVIKVDRLLDES